MKNDNEIIESLIAGGIIGAALGALITNNKNGAGLGAIAGAAILATFKANELAKKMNFPLIVEENNTLYQIEKDGTKRLLKQLSKPSIHVAENFTLE
ncbi:MAG: hypothetical protein ACKVOQ_14665 [Cyclobacteriaceae bacterium]